MSQAGDRPTGWNPRALGDLFETQLGKMLSAKARAGADPRPYLRNANVQWDRIDCTDLYEMDFSPDERKKFVLSEGDLLVCEGGEIGRSAIWRGQLSECYYQKAIHRLRPKDAEAVSVDFMLLHMWHQFGNSLGPAAGGASSTIAHLPQDKLQRLIVPLPPLAEQRAIARALKALQAARDARRRELELEQERKAALMEHLFTKGTCEDGGAWRTQPLSTVARVQTGVAKGRKTNGDEAVDLPYLRVANVQDGYLDLAEIKTIRLRRTEVDRYSLRTGDVVLTEGGDFDKLGRGFVWEGQIPGCVHQNHVFAVRTDRDELLPEFLAYQAGSSHGKAYFLSVAHKTTNLACINSTKLKAFPVLLPDLDEQREIVQVLVLADAVIERVESEIALLDELFRAMLEELMTGRLSAVPLIEDGA